MTIPLIDISFRSEPKKFKLVSPNSNSLHPHVIQASFVTPILCCSYSSPTIKFQLPPKTAMHTLVPIPLWLIT